jgi:hypothetical protein
MGLKLRDMLEASGIEPKDTADNDEGNGSSLNRYF